MAGHSVMTAAGSRLAVSALQEADRDCLRPAACLRCEHCSRRTRDACEPRCGCAGDWVTGALGHWTPRSSTGLASFSVDEQTSRWARWPQCKGTCQHTPHLEHRALFYYRRHSPRTSAECRRRVLSASAPSLPDAPAGSGSASGAVAPRGVARGLRDRRRAPAGRLPPSRLPPPLPALGSSGLSPSSLAATPASSRNADSSSISSSTKASLATWLRVGWRGCEVVI